MCEVCGFTNIAKDDPIPFDEGDYNTFIDGVWQGSVTKYTLPTHIYLKTAKHLNEGVAKGFGKDFLEVSFDTPDYEMLKEMSDNIYMFSGAKTYHQYLDVSELVMKHRGSYFDFKKEAIGKLTEYNEAYLRAEYQAAVGSSRMAGKWMRIEEEKDILPYLQYETVGDARVRPEHAQLDNIIKRVDDIFWRTLYPPNGWNCRCTVIQLAEGKETNTSGMNLYDNVPDAFKMNAGIEKKVFKDKGKDKHPYFVVKKGDKELAKKNFNLPTPK